MKTIYFLLISGIFLYALLILALFIMQRSFLYFPSNERPDLSQYAAIGLEEVKLKTEAGLELTAWFMKPDPAQGREIPQNPGGGLRVFVSRIPRIRWQSG